MELDERLRSTWVQGMPLTVRAQGLYKEQPGLQPEIRDVRIDREGEWLTSEASTLLCHAEKIGLLMQVDEVYRL